MKDLKVKRHLISQNYSSRHGTAVEYIVVHDTGNPRPGADAMAHYHYFNNGYRGASAHYFVDDKGVIQTVDDRFSAWHCGDGRGRYGITNRNSIGVEMCIHKDGDFEQTKAHTIALLRMLCHRYHFSRHRVVRHYNASRKICPRVFSGNEWHDWWDFWSLI